MPKAANKVKVQTTPYNVARHLRTPEKMALYLDASIRESDGDPAFVAAALGDIAPCAKGMAQLAKETGLGRESLHKALSSTGDPELGTFLKVTRALGMKISATPA